MAIARALAPELRLVVADEALSSVDVPIQLQILQLLKRLKERLHLSFLCISHDLGAIVYLCDRVAVMRGSKVVEMALAEELFQNPIHPHTRALQEAILMADARTPGLRLWAQPPLDEAAAETQGGQLQEVLPGHRAVR